LPLLLTIPFDRRIAEAYSRGKMVVEELPEWRQQFIDLFGRIEQIITISKEAVCAN